MKEIEYRNRKSSQIFCVSGFRVSLDTTKIVQLTDFNKRQLIGYQDSHLIIQEIFLVSSTKFNNNDQK